MLIGIVLLYTIIKGLSIAVKKKILIICKCITIGECNSQTPIVKLFNKILLSEQGLQFDK